MTTKRTTFAIKFYCKESKMTKDGYAPLMVSVTVNGERLFLNLPSKFKPAEFNKKKQPSYVVETVENYRVMTYNIINDLIKLNIPITAHQLREYLRTGGIKTKTVKYVWEEYLELIKKRNTLINKYKIAMNICINKFGENTEITTIQNKDILLLIEDLKTKYQQSTLGGILTKIKGLFTYCKDNNYIQSNPFSSIKIDKGETKPIVYLNENDIIKLENAEVDLPYLQKAKDLLLFQLYAGGMSYIDMINFQPNKLKEVNGVYVYEDKRKKTGIKFSTIILPQAINILKKYDNNLPIISNQKLNQYAKIVAKYANIKINLTTHICRKSFAHLMLNRGISIESVAVMLGHSNTTITQKIYCRKSNESIVNEFINKF
jgi:site-specific recombinase XerD